MPSATAAIPTPPAAPSTSRVSPGCSSARSTSACIDVAYVNSVAAPTSKPTASGSATTALAATTMRSANAPCTTVAATRSPTATVSTPGPTAVTTPAASPPGTKGGGGRN